MRILYYNSSYTYLSYQDVDSGTPGSPSLVSWVQRTGSFTSLSNAAYVKVQLRTQMTSGWITFDDITLQGGAERVYYEAGGTRIAMHQNGTLLWLLGDHVGSTHMVANRDGSFHSEQLYKPWGGKRYPAGAPTLPTTIRYTGQRAETRLGPSGGEGLYYYGARHYDPYLNN